MAKTSKSLSEQMTAIAESLGLYAALLAVAGYPEFGELIIERATKVRAIAESIKALSDSWREEHDDRIRLEERCKRLQGRVEYWKQEAQGNDSALSELTSLMFPEDEQK